MSSSDSGAFLCIPGGFEKQRLNQKGQGDLQGPLKTGQGLAEAVFGAGERVHRRFGVEKQARSEYLSSDLKVHGDLLERLPAAQTPRLYCPRPALLQGGEGRVSSCRS